MHEHIIAASGTGVPIALLNTFVSIWRRPGLPPPHYLARPGVGWMGSRAGTALLWRALQIRKWRTTWSLRLRRIGCDRLSMLRRLAREAVFDMARETDDRQWLIPFTYRSYPVLSLHALEFEFPHDPPDRVHFVGPMVLERRPDREMTPDDHQRLEAVLDRRRRAERDRKLVYAGFGSAFSTDLDFLRRLFAVAAENRHWDLIVSLGDRAAPAELGRLPEGVHAFTWIPQTTVLQSADVVVTHGGINTIDECVLAGVPMLVYCGYETDMGGTTARVAYHGIGIAGDRRRDGLSEIRSHIGRLLHESSFQTKIRHFQRLFAAYADDRVAERTVASLLGHESHARSPDTPGAVT
jgi:UDP:flavonoid glycosyltransferase YjiC (YdhE family)